MILWAHLGVIAFWLNENLEDIALWKGLRILVLSDEINRKG
jgi:hypothetical protein